MAIFMQHLDADGNRDIDRVYEVTADDPNAAEAQATHLESRGWVRIAPVLLAAVAVVGHDVVKLDELTKDELSEVAVRNHVAVDAKATKSDLVTAITEGFGAAQEADLSTALHDEQTAAALSEPTAEPAATTDQES